MKKPVDIKLSAWVHRGKLPDSCIGEVTIPTWFIENRAPYNRWYILHSVSCMFWVKPSCFS